MIRTDRIREACWYADRLFAGRHYRAVLALATRSLAEEGEDAALRLRRARALLAMHRDDEARADLGQALLLAPREITAPLLLCELALRARDLPAAERYLIDAMRVDARNPRVTELTAVIRGWRMAIARTAAARTAAGPPAPVSHAA